MTERPAEMPARRAEGPRLRPVLAGLPRYVPGRPASAGEGLRTYKASSTENPYRPLPSVVEAIARAAAEVNRYPDLTSADLVAALAERLEVPPGHLALGTGSVGVCQQLVQAVAGPGDEVVYAWRSFEAYPIIVAISGATSVQVSLRADEGHDLGAMAAALTPRTRAVFVCNPNNPTGAVARRAELVRFLDAVPSDVLVVVDEAYREFVTDPEVPDGLDLYRDRPNVCVLRTFSKAYGLAGLRVGFAVAHPQVAEALRQTAVPFGVSTVAQRAAIASLEAEDELLERVRTLVAERDRLVAGLRGQGWTVGDSQANFVWLRLGARTQAFAAACAKAGVSVRPYGDEGVRITAAEPAAGDRVLAVAAAFGAEPDGAA